jgi:ATP-dependent DNA helicase RecQ
MKQRHDLTREELLIERAYVLQGMIRAGRQNIREQEAEYKDIVAQLQETGQSRFGRYSIVRKVQQRRAIISDKFFRLWPQAFMKLARVSIKDAEAELGKEQLEAVKIFEVKDQVSTEIIRHELPAKREIMV